MKPAFSTLSSIAASSTFSEVMHAESNFNLFRFVPRPLQLHHSTKATFPNGHSMFPTILKHVNQTLTHCCLWGIAFLAWANLIGYRFDSQARNVWSTLCLDEWVALLQWMLPTLDSTTRFSQLFNNSISNTFWEVKSAIKSGPKLLCVCSTLSYMSNRACKLSA